MSVQTLKFEIKVNLPLFVVASLVVHVFAVMLFMAAPSMMGNDDTQQAGKKPAPIMVTIGKKDSKSKNSVYVKPQAPAMPQLPQQKPGPKNIHLSDLMAPSTPTPKIQPKGEPSKPQEVVVTRPGTRPGTKPSALQGIRYGADEFKKMAGDSNPMFQGGADLSARQVALNFEVPEGKDASELNESQLKLYGFLRRGAMKYVASLSSEIKEFELQNPHLHFPLVENKQTLTGRLVYDNQGNLKQIKMVRWSNNDKLQGFFEKVLKRLDTLQNPPKELWTDSGEFTVFVTLQIN